MINIHSHIFTDEDIPNGFLPLGLVRILRTKLGYKVFKGLLHNLVPFSKKDMFDKTLHFIQAGRLGSQEDIMKGFIQAYPKGSEFVILPMDMEYMGAGKIPRPYKEQLLHLHTIALHNEKIKPFLALDCRRPEMNDLFQEFIIDKKWAGIKMYPPLGTFPQDFKYQGIYEYCEENSIPIMAHCTYGNPVHFKGRKKELKELLGAKYIKGMSRKEACNVFTNPDNWEEVSRKYPGLKICLAHSGGMGQWLAWMSGDRSENNLLTRIKRMCKENNNMYMDVSFTLSDLRLIPLLKVLLQDEKLNKKILFGSDYYMNLTENFSEGEWSINFRGLLGEKDFRQISVLNNERYLYE